LQKVRFPIVRTIALISCGKSKLNRPAPAQQLYTGDLFQKSLAYARHRGADSIYILSAKYGLVELNQMIEPYEKTLNRMPSSEVRRWADEVLSELRLRTDFARDKFIFLAGDKYRSLLIPHLARIEVPLLGLGFGKQLKFLKESTT
jgi:hypothetical protein